MVDVETQRAAFAGRRGAQGAVARCARAGFFGRTCHRRSVACFGPRHLSDPHRLTPITPRDDVVLIALLHQHRTDHRDDRDPRLARHRLWNAWRDEVPGARLHVRIVGLFSIIAALPAILLAVAATTTFSRAIDSWFTARARAIIDNSMEVAQSYLQEHGSVIRTDVANMARDIDAAAMISSTSRKP